MKRSVVKASAAGFAILAFAVSSSSAQVPQLINYQGRLLNGTNLVNGTVVLSLRLFDAASGGNRLYEDSNSVTVVDGLYSTTIGDNTTMGSLTNALTNAAVYVEVVVNGIALTPRERLTSVAYALNAPASSAIAGSGAVSWQIASNTSLTAAPNTGYLITNNSAQTTIALPASPSIGDVIRISSPGSGGWKISQNASQSISVGVSAQFSAGDFWTPHESTRNWQAVASSSDGSKLVAVVNVGGQIYTSADSGATWTPHESNRYWSAVASSSDGSKLVAAVGGGGQLYTSTNSGATWTPRDSTNRNWISVASSSDGSKLVAADNGQGQLYTSTDSGATWTPRDTNRYWRAVASSSDGSKLIAAVQSGCIYTSADSGATWTPRDTNRYWQAVASSSDGSELAAVEWSGHIHISMDSGATWMVRESELDRHWSSIAMSPDGSKLVAMVFGGQLFTSADSGATWTPRGGDMNCWSVAMSSDGRKLVTAVFYGQIWTSSAAFGSPGSTTTTAGSGGYLTGGQGTAIELQYIGNGQFMTLSQSGSLYAQ